MRGKSVSAPCVIFSLLLEKRPEAFGLEVLYGFGQFPALAVGRRRPCTFCRVSKIQEHYYFFVFWKRKFFCHSFRVDKIDPAAFHAGSLCGKEHMCGYDRGVFDAGVSFAAWINKYILFIIGRYQDGGSAKTAAGQTVDLGQPFF